MRYFLVAVYLAVFVAALVSGLSANSARNELAKNFQCNNVNYNFYTGAYSKKIQQQLAEMKKEIKALKSNLSDCAVNSGLSTEVKQQLSALIKQEIRALKGNQTGGSGDHGFCSKVKEQLDVIQRLIMGLNGSNHTGGSSSVNGSNQAGGSSGNVYKNCAEAYKSGDHNSGVYKIDPDGLGEFQVFCDQKTAGGGWTVFQKRYDGSVDFYRGWTEYKQGFGNLSGEFWLGMDKIHRLTVSNKNNLRVDLEDLHGNTVYAEYSSFAVANETVDYQLSLGSYSGTAGDSLSYHRGIPFSTKENDNTLKNCAMKYHGAWWYRNCYYSNLNGQYGPSDDTNYSGMVWYHWKKKYNSVKRSEMKIRPKDF